MRRKLFFTALTIALVAALVGGGTMAIFGFKVNVDPNTFTAGRVEITAGNETVYPINLEMDNVNPGDAFKKCIPVENTGTKNIRLRMLSELEFDIDDIDWERVGNHFEGLCFSNTEWETVGDLRDAVDEALEDGRVTNPADAIGEPNGPFDGGGNLVIPIMVAPTESGDWVMKNVDGEIMFFYDGILEPDDDTNLCIVVVFDGPWMGNLWQGATITLEGTFQAVQSSNDAPEEFWGEDVWENYENVIALTDARARLAADFSDAYVDYFYNEDGDFYYWYLCILNGNGNGGWFDETAWGGDTEGDGPAWWFYFDLSSAIEEGEVDEDGNYTQTIHAGQELDAGEVTITVIPRTIDEDGKVAITMILFEDWRLEQDDNGNVINEAVKIKGYSYDDLPATRPASGELDDYKGTDLYVELDHDPPFDVYLIHMDVEEYRE